MFIYRETLDELCEGSEVAREDYLTMVPGLVAYIEVWPSDEACKAPTKAEEKAYTALKKALAKAKLHYDEWPADGPCNYLMLFLDQAEYDQFKTITRYKED